MRSRMAPVRLVAAFTAMATFAGTLALPSSAAAQKNDESAGDDSAKQRRREEKRPTMVRPSGLDLPMPRVPVRPGILSGVGNKDADRIDEERRDAVATKEKEAARLAADAKGDKGAEQSGDGKAATAGATPAPEDDELYRCKKHPKNAKIKVTLKPETEFKELVQWAMGFTCRSFVYSAGARAGKVTVIAPTEMSPQDAWNLFLTSLQTMNLTVVRRPGHPVLEIIESSQAREKPLPVYRRSGDVPSGDEIVRVLIRPEHLSIEDASAILSAFKSKDGAITPQVAAGVLVVTDYGSTLDRMLDVLREVDQPLVGDQLYIIRVRHSDATELGTKLTEIFGVGQGRPVAVTARPAKGKKDSATASATVESSASSGEPAAGNAVPTKIIPDARTNSLVVISSQRAYERVLALVQRLDVPGQEGAEATHVYYLNNADSEQLSTTLNALISGQQRSSRAGGAGGGGGGDKSGQSAGAVSAAAKVTFDKSTNSLVVIASTQDFFSLRDVIRKLDVPRRQVFVEATILEVSVDKARKMGISYHGGLPVLDDEALLFGGVQHGDLGTVVLNPASLLGVIGGVRGAEIPGSAEFLGISVPSFGLMFQIIQNDNDVNVLSSPHILTTDNVPAEMTVGENIPFQSGVTSLPGGAGGQAGGFGFPLQSIQRQDVALKLKLTPHVNDSDQVRLEIEQEISDIASEDFGGLGPSWTKRTVKTEIVVKDQQPVVIGGLMKDRTLISESKVPLLGDIPVLGYFFKYQTKTKQKTNLLLLLTPYVIKDQSDLRRIYERKTRERREFLETFTGFAERDYTPDLDHRRTRGLIEDINASVRMSEDDAKMMFEADEAERLRDPGGLVEFTPTPVPAPDESGK